MSSTVEKAITKTNDLNANSENNSKFITKQTSKIKDKAAAAAAELASLFAASNETTATNGAAVVNSSVPNGNNQNYDKKSVDTVLSNVNGDTLNGPNKPNHLTYSNQNETISIDTSLPIESINTGASTKNSLLKTVNNSVDQTDSTKQAGGDTSVNVSKQKTVKSPTKSIGSSSFSNNNNNNTSNTTNSHNLPSGPGLLNLNSAGYLNDLMFNHHHHNQQNQQQQSNYSNSTI